MAKSKTSSADQSATASDPKDYYALLGVDKSADDEALKKAYRKMAMKYHPDRNPGDAQAEETFKNVKTAYETLSTPDLRASYDRFGADGPQGFPNGFSGSGGFSGSNNEDVMAEILRQFMGQGFGQNSGFRTRRSGTSTPPPPVSGEDIVVAVNLTLEEAFTGKTIEVSIPVEADCTVCDGTGSKTKSKATTCPTCKGNGVVQSSNGFFNTQHECPSCHGTGKRVPAADACEKCKGQGYATAMEPLEVNIPAGIDANMRVRLSGRGRKSHHSGGAQGDLYVEVDVEEHERYQRDGLDLHTGLDILWTTAALGGVQLLTLLDGTELEVNIPEATQDSQILRAKERGMPNPRNPSERGHLMLHLQVQVPTKLTKAQKRMMQALQTSFNENPAEHLPTRTSWLEKAKNWLE